MKIFLLLFGISMLSIIGAANPGDPTPVTLINGTKFDTKSNIIKLLEQISSLGRGNMNAFRSVLSSHKRWLRHLDWFDKVISIYDVYDEVLNALQLIYCHYDQAYYNKIELLFSQTTEIVNADGILNTMQEILSISEAVSTKVYIDEDFMALSDRLDVVPRKYLKKFNMLAGDMIEMIKILIEVTEESLRKQIVSYNEIRNAIQESFKSVTEASLKLKTHTVKLKELSENPKRDQAEFDSELEEMRRIHIDTEKAYKARSDIMTKIPQIQTIIDSFNYYLDSLPTVLDSILNANPVYVYDYKTVDSMKKQLHKSIDWIRKFPRRLKPDQAVKINALIAAIVKLLEAVESFLKNFNSKISNLSLDLIDKVIKEIKSDEKLEQICKEGNFDKNLKFLRNRFASFQTKLAVFKENPNPPFMDANYDFNKLLDAQKKIIKGNKAKDWSSLIEELEKATEFIKDQKIKSMELSHEYENLRKSSNDIIPMLGHLRFVSGFPDTAYRNARTRRVIAFVAGMFHFRFKAEYYFII